MGHKHGEDFKREAVRLAVNCAGLSRLYRGLRYGPAASRW